MNCVRITLLTVVIVQSLKNNSMSQITAEDGLTINGYLESYFSYDFDEPDDHLRPFFIYNFNRANEVNVNLAFVKLAYSKDNVRGNFSLMAGTYANANLASEQGVLRNIFEANAGVKLSKEKEIWLDAGILPSHIGFESAIGKDCWTLTRSIPAEGSPYYESGARISYQTPDSELYISGLILNGWQRINRVDGNNTIAFGTQVTIKPNESILINNSTYIGNDFPDSTKRTRFFADTYMIWNMTKFISSTLGFDIGVQQKSSGSSDYLTWYSPIVILRANLAKELTAAVRLEYFHDPSQIIFSTNTASGFRTFGYSLNFDYIIAGRALFRIEGRGFESKDMIFDKNGELKTNNFAISTSLSLSF